MACKSITPQLKKIYNELFHHPVLYQSRVVQFWFIPQFKKTFSLENRFFDFPHSGG